MRKPRCFRSHRCYGGFIFQIQVAEFLLKSIALFGKIFFFQKREIHEVVLDPHIIFLTFGLVNNLVIAIELGDG